MELQRVFDFLANPIPWKGALELVGVLAGIAIARLGYRLVASHRDGNGELRVDDPPLHVGLRGAPGMFFMAFGATIIAIALTRGPVTVTRTHTVAAPAARPARARSALQPSSQTRQQPVRRDVEQLTLPSVGS